MLVKVLSGTFYSTVRPIFAQLLFNSILLLQVDHFGYANQDSFNLRYLVADQFWDKKHGPVFFYTGNEGDIDWFCNNTVSL